MKTLKKGAVTYYINEEKRTVVATTEIMSCDLAEEFTNIVRKAVNGKGSRFSFNPIGITPVYYFGNKVFKFKGKAVCHVEDIFSEEIGMALAHQRLMVNVYNFKKEKMREIYTILLAYTDRAEEAVENYSNQSWAYGVNVEEIKDDIVKVSNLQKGILTK